MKHNMNRYEKLRCFAHPQLQYPRVASRGSVWFYNFGGMDVCSFSAMKKQMITMIHMWNESEEDLFSFASGRIKKSGLQCGLCKHYFVNFSLQPRFKNVKEKK